MKNGFLLVLAGLLLSVGLCACSKAQKIAIVDVQAVVNKSEQVQALKKEQEEKLQALEQWIKTAQADVENQELKANKDELLKKYNDELAKKREAITREYQEKLQEIDRSITDTIKQTAKDKGYGMVISKSIVIMGGDDITADVQESVK
jgi:Skp family chaperone for outer membrane proteins